MSADLRRALVFLLYDPSGVCDVSVLDTLKGFRPHVETIFVVSNGALETASLEIVSSVADQVLERPNVGYDVGAYRDALTELGWDTIASYDELVLANSTFFGPVGSFEALFSRMSHKNVDFWGVTDHPAVTPHPYTGKGTMPQHLQSYWLALSKNLLRSPEFRRYWETLPDPTSYADVVTNFECKFTQHFANLGFTWQAAFPSADYGVANTTMEAPLALLEDGCPLFKKRLYFHDVPALVEQGIVTAAVTAQAKRLGYSEDLIVDGIIRRTTTRELTEGLGAGYVQTTDVTPGVTQTGHREDDFPNIRFTTSEAMPWKRLGEDGIDALMGDAAVLIVTPRPPKQGLRADGIHLRWTNASAAISSDPSYIESLFSMHRRLGALYPYIQLVGNTVRGRKWFEDSLLAKDLAEKLGLHGKFCQKSPVAPYRGAAAYRREVVQLIDDSIRKAGGWKELVEFSGDETALHHTVDLLTADIAKNSGYFAGETGTFIEARRSLLLFADLYSNGPRIFRDYTYYPYSGHVIAPTFKNRVGQSVKNFSPELFDRLHRLEKQVRSNLSELRKLKK